MTRKPVKVGTRLVGAHLGLCSCGAAVSYLMDEHGEANGALAHVKPMCEAFKSYDPDGDPAKPGGIIQYMRAHITPGSPSS